MPASPPHCTAIIVAAGSSRRMGFDKLSSPIAGLPVLRRTLDAFLSATSISAVVIVCPEDRWTLLSPIPSNKPVTRTDGGADRQHSVARGLAAVPSETQIVAVHDGARPLISPHDIDRCVSAAIEHRAATLACRATETLKRSDDHDFCSTSVSREHLWFMQTPQAFDLALLREAYAAVAEQNLTVTDEVSALQSIGAPVKFIEARHPNLKITTPADLALAEALLTRNS